MSLWKVLMARKDLVKAFRAANIYKTIGSDEKKIYPKIHSVKINDLLTEFVFTLPIGIDPKLLKKNYFVFQQVFGEQIKLDGEVKRFVLNVYPKREEKTLKYNSKEIGEIIKGFKLGIICGKERTGEYIAFDLLKQPHILIAGETGSGKSTQLRSILTTMILNNKPSKLQLYLGDCKKSEFHIFRKVEHVQCVLSNGKEIAKMLRHIKKELDERSDLTETFEVSHVDDLPAEHKRPYIVVCIDEFVMLRKDETVMDILTEIVAIGRTLGVFAILSMQRPNAQVLDTTIRANLTVSMGFKLRDKIEARIVNTPDAEKIEVSGRFIMNSDKLYDLQAPYLELDEAKKLLNPFCISKDAKEINEEPPIPPQLTEKDVFNDVD
ncbi:FtsK/SpoIIIE domain-containing protein [Heyndrickxia sporothermodurans]|uniref:FtsK/SpoIIIE domain-containing protein n=1 Tax=Heyndrickxia sporothermodurans TaxID=46224 RepID=UPI002E1E7FC8|nr:FtsK/SpoIIIE domain-containing protein [Heyndrickxia sporothermodurans]MED3650592.1 FtsK/SpoIIIE domain-containing protein [Heyndrickxia sporothermodurans]MED3697356.1 FtsK/SpoIIIE domain-containing protein [Heyndrickxia sporothermodurans]